MTIQINKDWRIREVGDNFILEKSDGEEWHYRASSLDLAGVLRAYFHDRFTLTPIDTPSDLLTPLPPSHMPLFRKLSCGIYQFPTIRYILRIIL